MRISFEFSFRGKLILPLNYNYILQGFIYDNIADWQVRNFMHNEGFTFKKRKYKLFTFSRLLGKYKIDNNNKIIQYEPNVNLEVSSYYNDFFVDFSTSVMKNELILYDQRIFLENVKVKMQHDIKNKCKIRMLSPLVVYSTDSHKVTNYYSPEDERFSELISENIKKKYQAFYNVSIDHSNFEIKPVPGTQKAVVSKYKDFIIKGWMGDYYVKGDKDLVLLAYDAGLGSKNSQGYGCFEFIR